MNRKLSEQILNNIDDEYIAEAINYTYTRQKKRTAYKILKYAGKTAACLGLFLGLSASSLLAATAAGNMTAYDILHSFSPDIAVKLTPVNVYCEDKGIRMEVEGISVHDNSAEIYISMQDLEGDRIDETIDLFDSYSIHTSCDQIGGCTRIAYDPAAKKATFLISVQQMDDTSIIGKKMTFSVSEFLSGKKEVNQKLSQIHLEDAMPAAEMQTAVEIRGMSGMGMKESAENDVSGYLIADDAKSFSPADGVTVTNYGFIDNRLHIQTYYEDILKYDNHGYVYLKDSEGNIINSLISISFWDKDRKGSFDEEIFDISPEADLSEYSVWGYFNTCKTKVQGDWKVTFPIENI